MIKMLNQFLFIYCWVEPHAFGLYLNDNQIINTMSIELCIRKKIFSLFFYSHNGIAYMIIIDTLFQSMILYFLLLVFFLSKKAKDLPRCSSSRQENKKFFFCMSSSSVLLITWRWWWWLMSGNTNEFNETFDVVGQLMFWCLIKIFRNVSVEFLWRRFLFLFFFLSKKINLSL